MVAPTAKPNIMITTFIKAFSETSANLGTTPETLIKLPNISMPISGEEEGTSTPIMIMVNTGNNTCVRFDTGFDGYSIRIKRSFLVVNSLIIGG